MKNIAKIILVSALGGAMTLGAYKTFFESPKVEQVVQASPASFMKTGALIGSGEASFTEAAEKTVNSVVHVKTAVESNGYSAQNPMDLFFGNPRSQTPRIQMGSGSGVIISKDGYIVTNNHVIDNAKTISITLNDQTEYEAEIVGADPTTDIALIKIKAEVDLPYLIFSNSDEARLGEWVLAVGNPFNLTSTVTAGIVSAKGRNIGIINERAAIESFIQTDAVVNPGNSGGALVNTRGELIGINSAISTHTGSFEGYSFAVPSNIVQKVVRDLLEFGTIQRAFIGVNISDVTSQLAEKLDIKVSNGVYVGGVTENGAAEDAGIETGDVIIAVDDRKVVKSSELQELIGRKRPGDKVSVLVNRDGKEKIISVELRNMEGTTGIVKKDIKPNFLSTLGADLKPVDGQDKSRLGINYGVEVQNLRKGVLSDLGIPNGFIITRINRREIHAANDIASAVKDLAKRDPVVIEGYTPEGRSKYFAFGY